MSAKAAYTRSRHPRMSDTSACPIRAIIQLATGRGEYGTGGGITWSSHAGAEWDELRAKCALCPTPPGGIQPNRLSVLGPVAVLTLSSVPEQYGHELSSRDVARPRLLADPRTVHQVLPVRSAGSHHQDPLLPGHARREPQRRPTNQKATNKPKPAPPLEFVTTRLPTGQA